MKAIITVVGKDKAGIVAGVSTKIADLGLKLTIFLKQCWMNIYHDGSRI